MAKGTTSPSRESYVELFKSMLQNQADPGVEVDESKPYLQLAGTGGWIASATEPDQRLVIGLTESGEPRPHVALAPDGVVAFRKLIRLYESTADIGDIISRDELENAVLREFQNLVARPPKDDDNWQERIKAFGKSLRSLRTAHKVYLPVVNLHLEADLTIGGVRFIRAGVAKKEIILQAEKRLSAKRKPSGDLIGVKERIAEILALIAASPCCAVVTVHSDSSRAREIAYDAARKSMNLLRCYIPVIYGMGTGHRIGLADDTAQVLVPALLVAESGSYSTPAAVEGYRVPFEFNKQILNYMRKRGAFDQLSAILGKPAEERTPLERAIATAIWWIGSGNHRTSSAEQAVALATGLEALLIPEKSDEITEDVAYRGSFLLASSPEERAKIHVRIKRLYGLRSAVVHQGAVHMPDEELADLKYYALAVLVELAKRSALGLTNITDFIKSLDSVRFGAQPPKGPNSIIPRGPWVLSVTARFSTEKPELIFRMQH